MVTLSQFPMHNTEINNWVKDRRPIVYSLDVDGMRVRLK